MKTGDKFLSNENLPMGTYTNRLSVGYNAYEFILDFQQFFPENGQMKHQSRIITGPAYAKAFLEVFQASVKQFEENFGVIEINEEED